MPGTLLSPVTQRSITLPCTILPSIKLNLSEGVRNVNKCLQCYVESAKTEARTKCWEDDSFLPCVAVDFFFLNCNKEYDSECGKYLWKGQQNDRSK